MLCIVEPQAAHRAGVLRGKGREQQADVGDLVSYMVRTEDVALNDSRLFRSGEIGAAASGEDCVAVVGAAITGEETNETLEEGKERGELALCAHRDGG